MSLYHLRAKDVKCGSRHTVKAMNNLEASRARSTKIYEMLYIQKYGHKPEPKSVENQSENYSPLESVAGTKPEHLQ